MGNVWQMKAVLKRAFTLGLKLNAWLTRDDRLRFLEGRLTTPFFVRLTKAVSAA
jgi:hypothetical protein